MLVGIDSAITLSSGEVGAFLVDGLFALDREGVLFPGLGKPEHRLLEVMVGAIGYHRWGRTVPIGDAYRHLITEREGRAARGKRSLKERLDDAYDVISAGLLTQRTLMARLKGLSDRCLHPSAITDEDRRTAEALVSAADAIAAAVDAASGSSS
jgi:hypothetical protein